MNVAEHLQLRQRKNVAVVLQILDRVLEALPAKVRPRHPVSANADARHSSDDSNAALEDSFKRMLMSSGHIFPMVPSVEAAAAEVVTCALAPIAPPKTSIPRSSSERESATIARCLRACGDKRNAAQEYQILRKRRREEVPLGEA